MIDTQISDFGHYFFFFFFLWKRFYLETFPHFLSIFENMETSVWKRLGGKLFWGAFCRHRLLV